MPTVLSSKQIVFKHNKKMKKTTLYSLIFFVVSSTLFSQAWKTYPYSPAGSLISFQIDEGRHILEPSEWWYTWRNKTDAFGNPLPFEYKISASGVNRSLNLEYDALKPPLILADSGSSIKDQPVILFKQLPLLILN